MPDAVERLRALGFELPPVAPAVGNYVGAVSVGNLVFVSGHGPFEAGKLRRKGKLGGAVSLAEGRAAAEIVMLNALASLQAEIGDLDRVQRIVKLFGMVASEPSFTEQPKVIDAASDLLVHAFHERGRHARSAVGMAVLPFDIPVEIEMIVQIE
jgi:enamine deaminase RidA (YjgF/YER057c/UK114 family)